MRPRVLRRRAVTVSCAEGDTGYVYDGLLRLRVSRSSRGEMPPAPVKIMMNVGNPERAFDFAQPAESGVGLARLEFIINRMIGVHPRRCSTSRSSSRPEEGRSSAQMRAATPIRCSSTSTSWSRAWRQIACAFWPKPVIVRLSDFKSNEYANLIGGKRYEPHEENPMLGFRGASRYIDAAFRPASNWSAARCGACATRWA
jgi:pyruvate,water dikinase